MINFQDFLEISSKVKKSEKQKKEGGGHDSFGDVLRLCHERKFEHWFLDTYNGVYSFFVYGLGFFRLVYEFDARLNQYVFYLNRGLAQGFEAKPNSDILTIESILGSTAKISHADAIALLKEKGYIIVNHAEWYSYKMGYDVGLAIGTKHELISFLESKITDSCFVHVSSNYAYIGITYIKTTSIDIDSY